MTDQPAAPQRSKKRAIIAGLLLLLIVVAGELFSFAVRHLSDVSQTRGNEWARLRCLDHGRNWDASDKTESPLGTCH